jgi:hypothetical protein
VTKRAMRLGELLVHLGRVTEDQVAAALEHQRAHGGYMGDALIEMGALSREELRWTLADQYDIPFVRLRPENIDRGLAAMVPAAWAREHHMLPVLRDGDRVTVVIGDVTDLEKLEEVRRMTGAGAVEPALSSPELIQELVESVYAPAVQPPGRLLELVTDAVTHDAVALGVSVRGGSAIGWYRVVETVHRPLLPEWEAELADLFAPAPLLTAAPTASPRTWRGLLTLGERSWWVDCAAAGQGRSLEWSAKLIAFAPHGLVNPTIDPDVSDAVRTALMRGPVLASVQAPRDSELSDAVARAVSGLPELLLGPGFRSIHVTDARVCAGRDTLVLQVRDGVERELQALEAFSPQAVSADVDRVGGSDAEAFRRAAPLTVVRGRSPDAPAFPHDLELHLRLDAGGFTWSLSGAGNGED